jgi:hypothetical protein
MKRAAIPGFVHKEKNAAYCITVQANISEF